MTQSTLRQDTIVEGTESQWMSLCRIGGIAAFLQLACLFISLFVGTIFGAEPDTAADAFRILEQDGAAGLLRLDFATLILICLCALSSFGIFAALRRSDTAYAALATALIYVGTILALADHSAFSLMRLADQYAAASSVAQGAQLLAAGEAIIAGNMWNSTGGFLAGIFMQGGFVFISAVMLRRRSFSKGTAYTGLLANGLDLAHVFVALFLPSLATILLMIGGLFYLAWFPLLGRDLVRLSREVSEESFFSARSENEQDAPDVNFEGA
jgi:hypothetical protein